MSLSHYPALTVEAGAVFILIAALASRVILSRFGIPSIVTLLAFGLLAGPSAIDVLHVNLSNPSTRALLSLAVVIILFEATLRIDVRGVPKATIAILAVAGAGGAFLLIPPVVRMFGFSPLLSSMIASICIVTGPTVIGPLMARLRPRKIVAHILESEGLALDALGVIVAAAVFAAYTSRPGAPFAAALHVTQRIGAGVVVGVVWGFLGRVVLSHASRASSDVSKIGVLLLGFGAYVSAEFLSHESGLVSVVACGLLLDFHLLPHERLLRAFKEDLSMLALSVVFVLLSSQIQIERLGPLIAVAAAVTGSLIVIRIATVWLATWGRSLSTAERMLMAATFPRGIVAISLATYYATQVSAWGLQGGSELAGILFLIVIMTIGISTPAAIVATRQLGLRMQAVVIAGITFDTLEIARKYKDVGHVPLLVDVDAQAVALARSQDLEAVALDEHTTLADVVRKRRPKFVIVEEGAQWWHGERFPVSVTVLSPQEARELA